MSVADLIEKFRSVALDRVEKMNLVLVGLEREPDDEAATEELLREVHTLKGEAKMMGFADVNLVSHLTEHLLLDAAKVAFDIEKTSMDLIFEGLDILRSLLTKSAGAGDNPIDLAGFVDRVAEARFAESSRRHREPKAPAMPAPEPAPSAEETVARGDATAGLFRIQAGGTFRVDLNKLEKLGEVAGEALLMGRRIDYQLTQLEDFRESLRGWSESVSSMLPKAHTKTIRNLGHQLDALLTQLHDDVYLASSRASQLDDEARLLRHVPLAQVLSHYPRAVRDLARGQGKDVRFTHAFGDVQVDRAILSGLSDPLLHLIRNAVDHGIETPEEREKLGKEPEGEIRLTAEHSGDSIRVVLHDDGRGIDPALLRQKAVERGLFDESGARALSDHDAISLIFESGFTTRNTVTDVSGRGIGMDVVRRQITAIGGTVEVESEPGLGTTFTLNIPVSSAISSILMIDIGGQIFGLPAKDVERVMPLERDALLEVQGGWCLRHEERLVPLVDWRRILGREERAMKNEPLTLLLVRRAGRLAAVWVDAVVGEREAVTRPLGDFLGGIRLSRGVALTDAGEVVPLLNAPELLAQNLEELAPSREGKVRATMELQRVGGVRTILVVEDSEITRALVSGILKGLGYRVLEAEDGEDGWRRLQQSQVELVLTDIQMPRLDGLGLLERIRADARLASLPVVVLTTLGSPEDKERAMSLGADGYLVKLNFKEQELVRIVHRYVGANGP